MRASVGLDLLHRLDCIATFSVYNCADENCATVVGVAADDTASQLYYLLESANGTVELHALRVAASDGGSGGDAAAEAPTSQLLASTDNFPA